jgi:3-methyl-2-oxobutanoate hydroxymethyltransferase
MDIIQFKERKSKMPLKMITCYDYPSALAAEASPVDGVLVGDSVAMVVHGLPNTLHCSMGMVKIHTAAVARGLKTKLLVADMPFLSFRKGKGMAVQAAGELMQAGAHAVKIEGVDGHEEVIQHLVQSGIPVMGHLGLTPQFIFQLGGFKLQGKTQEAEKQILAQAKTLESLGCFSIVLECVPTSLGKKITHALKIPTIGIGAGPFCDGQVLVWHDLLGLTHNSLKENQKPKFVREFGQLSSNVQKALQEYCSAVDQGSFPAPQESYYFPKSESEQSKTERGDHDHC